MISPYKLYKYLRFKDKFVSGDILAKNLRIPLHKLPTCYSFSGIGGMGPAGESDKPVRQSLRRYARRNFFDADFICTFSHRGKVFCVKGRPLREGKMPPRK